MIDLLTKFAGTCIFALVYNVQFFMCLSYLFLTMMAIYITFTLKGDKCSRRNVRYLSNIYSNFYRITLILKRISIFTMVSTSFCMWQNSLGFESICYTSNKYIAPKVLYALYSYFLFEQSNLLDIWINRQKITTRRCVYIICHFLLLAMSYFQSKLAFNVLITNHMVDLVKDLVQLFCKDKSFVEYVYKYKPAYLAITYFGYITNNQTVFSELVLPLAIIFVSAYDTLINYRGMFMLN